jgi:hypothetical protein
VLEKISLTEEGAAISALTEGDFRATGADYSELTGAIDYVNAVPGMKFSLILAERRRPVSREEELLSVRLGPPVPSFLGV